MNATHFRAYAVETVESRRDKQNIKHDVENVAFHGKVVDGVATFDAGDKKITRVVFYSGKSDDTTVVGSVDVGKSGAISAELPAG